MSEATTGGAVGFPNSVAPPPPPPITPRTCDDCTPFNVSIHIVIVSDGGPCGIAPGTILDETRTSDGGSATVECSPMNQYETWADDLTIPACSIAQNYTLNYGITCLGTESWLIGVNFTNEEDPAYCCTEGGGTYLVFQPSDLVTDPVGTHIFTLDAFSGSLHFTITFDIS